MVAFDVPRARVGTVGERLAAAAPITRCCRCTRRLPFWPYNLYCIVHSPDRTDVMRRVHELLPAGTGDLRRTVSFGHRRFRPAAPFTTINPLRPRRRARGVTTTGGLP